MRRTFTTICFPIKSYFPRRRCRDLRASSSRLWATSQIGVSGMKIIPVNKKSGKTLNTKARTHQSTKAPMMYATRIPRANALAVKELSVPRIRGEETSLICWERKSEHHHFRVELVQKLSYVNLWCRRCRAVHQTGHETADEDNRFVLCQMGETHKNKSTKEWNAEPNQGLPPSETLHRIAN